MIHFLQLFLLFVILSFCTVCTSAATEQITVAVVRGEKVTPLQQSQQGFQKYFQEKSIAIDVTLYHLTTNPADTERILKQISRQRPQIILCLGSRPLKALCSRLSEKSILIGVSLRKIDFECADEVGGVYLEYPPEIQLEWMHRILPQARNVGVIYSTEYNKKKIADANRLAKKMGVKIITREVSAPYQIPAALSYLANRTDVLWGVSDSTVLTPETVRKMLLFSFQNKVPFIGLSKAWGKAGALYALDRNYKDIGMQCAEMAHQEMMNKKEYSLHPKPPRLINYYLNMKTAEHLDITFSSPLVLGAEERY